jgi:hypothetical protein
MRKALAFLASLLIATLGTADVTGNVTPPGGGGSGAVIPSFGTAINVTNSTYGAKGDMVFGAYTVSITSGSAALSATGATFLSTDVGKMISIPGAGVTPTAASVAIAGTAGQFSCTCTNLAAGQPLTLTGTLGGTGAITGYTNPTTYYVSATNGTSTFTLVSAGNTALVTTAGTLTGLTYASVAQPLVSTIASYTSATQVVLGANAATTLSAVAATIAYGTDNASTLAAAISAAIAANAPLYIPSVGNKCFGYTAPLTVNGNLAIVGDYVSENWGASSYNSASIPLGLPALQGSVLCPSSNGSDAIDFTGNGPTDHVTNVGVIFQSYYVHTGHGLASKPPNTTGANEQGVSGGTWNNIKIFGHDGSHYAFYLQNIFYENMSALNTYGGGGMYMSGVSHDSIQYGNTTVTNLYSEVIVGGMANGIQLVGAASASLNLLVFQRPQVLIQNINGISPPGSLASGSQYAWNMDTFEDNLRLIVPSFTASNITGNALVNFMNCTGCDYDLANGFFNTVTQLGATQAAGTTLLGQNAPPGNNTGGSIYLKPGSGTGSGQNGSVFLTPQGSTNNATYFINTPASTVGLQAQLIFDNNFSIAYTFAMYQGAPNQIYLQDQASGETLFLQNSGGPFQIMPTAGNTNIGTTGATETIYGSILEPNVAASSSAQTGTACFGTGGALSYNIKNNCGGGNAPALGLSIPTGTATFAVGSGVTSVVCASGFSCNNSRGTLTIVGGTATTGTVATVSFSAALSAAPACFASMNGGSTLFSIGNSAPTTAAFNITAGISVIGATFNVNYSCQP